MLSPHETMNEAICHGRIAVVRSLLAEGASADGDGSSVFFPLLRAAGNGGVKHVDKIVALLLENGANPNQATVEGHTALLRAAEYGHVAVVEALLKHGADRAPASLSAGARPAFQAAASTRNNTEKTLEALFSPEEAAARNAEGDSLLHVAAARGSEKKVRFLSERMDPAEPNAQGENALALAAQSRQAPFFSRDSASVCRFLLAQAFDESEAKARNLLNAQDRDGGTAFFRMIDAQSFDLAVDSLSLADLSIARADGHTAFTFACHVARHGRSAPNNLAWNFAERLSERASDAELVRAADILRDVAKPAAQRLLARCEAAALSAALRGAPGDPGAGALAAAAPRASRRI